MKIFLASPIAARAIELLRAHHDVVAGFEAGSQFGVIIEDREALIFRSGVTITADLMAQAPKLQLAIRAGSGFDNIDLEYCADRGIRVVRVPGPSSQAVAEFTFGLIMTLSRRISEADAHMRRGRWPKAQLGGRLIAGKTLGVVGAGRIGKRVAEMGALWGMRVMACVERPVEEHQLVLAAKGITLTDFDSVVEQADILSVHTPLNDSTRGLIDAAVLNRMRPGAMLVNTSRGGVVDEDAVIAALRDGRLSGVALDVHEREGDGIVPPLSAMPNAVLTPHIGGMAIESQEMIGLRAVQLVDAYLRGRLDEESTDEEMLV
jgi:phosphoglycerate dehydrogenase-like enzyme